MTDSLFLGDKAALRPVAAEMPASVDLGAAEHGLDASGVEARLADEMARFVDALVDLSGRLKSISEDAGDQLGKLVAVSQHLFVLQISDAILKSLGECRSLDEYASGLGELELNFSDAFREVVLDGRKFACVALTNESARQFFQARHGCEQSGDVHVNSLSGEGLK